MQYSGNGWFLVQEGYYNYSYMAIQIIISKSAIV